MKFFKSILLISIIFSSCQDTEEKVTQINCDSNFSTSDVLLDINEEIFNDDSLILPLRKTTCSFYVNRLMPHLRPNRRNNNKKKKQRKKKTTIARSSKKVLPPLIQDNHQYFYNKQF